MLLTDTWVKVTTKAGLGVNLQRGGQSLVFVSYSETEPLEEDIGFVVRDYHVALFANAGTSEFIWARSSKGETATVAIEEVSVFSGGSEAAWVTDDGSLKSGLTYLAASRNDINIALGPDMNFPAFIKVTSGNRSTRIVTSDGVTINGNDSTLVLGGIQGDTYAISKDEKSNNNYIMTAQGTDCKFYFEGVDLGDVATVSIYDPGEGDWSAVTKGFHPGYMLDSTGACYTAFSVVVGPNGVESVVAFQTNNTTRSSQGCTKGDLVTIGLIEVDGTEVILTKQPVIEITSVTKYED